MRTATRFQKPTSNAPGGLRHTEVWTSVEQQERFHGEHVEPAVHGVLRSIGFTEMPPDPATTELVLIDVVTGS